MLRSFRRSERCALSRVPANGADRAMRVGYLLSIDQPRTISRMLSAASTLARSDPRMEVVMIAPDRRTAERIRRSAGSLLDTWVDLIELQRHGLPWRLFQGPESLYADNLCFFEGLDVLFTSDPNAYLLRSKFGLERIGIILSDPEAAVPPSVLKRPPAGSADMMARRS